MPDILFPTDTASKATPTTSDIILLADVADSNNPKDATLWSLPISTATQTALNAKQGTLTLTTTGSSWAATLIGDTLNIPQYSGGGGGSVATDSIWDAKGDLAVGTGANTASRLAVGTNGQILVADSAEATWLKWANATGGGDMLAATYDPANIAQQVVGTTATQTLTNKTLTAPRFADLGFIADQNGNEMLAFNSNASAVNYLELENGTTTNPPHLRARWDDTNIGLHLVAKGTGLVSVCDAVDETKRLRIQTSGNSTGVVTTLASVDTVAGTKTLPTGTTTLVGTDSTQTLTNKTLTAPIISTISNTGTLTLPTSTDTLVGRATTDTLTNKTLTSPTLTTPVLGTPTSWNLSNCTADGTNSVGFRHIPQNSQSAAYTLVLADAGDHILHPSADTTARTWTIPANSSVAFPIGTAITFINQNGAGVITIAITTDTMRLAGAGTTWSRTLAANWIATAIKINTTEWIISWPWLT